MSTTNKNTRSAFLLPFSPTAPGKQEKKKAKLNPSERSNLNQLLEPPLITPRPTNPSFGSFNVP